MRHSIFKSIFFTAMAVFLISLLCVTLVLLPYSTRQQMQSLKETGDALARLCQEGDESLLDQVLPCFSESQLRITLLSPEGQVLLDTRSDPGVMENHAQRTEFQQAITDGQGESVRYSKTLSRKTENYAVRLVNGNVLRISQDISSQVALAISLFTPFLLAVALALTLAFLLAARISKKLTLPLSRIDLRNPDDREVYEELRPLVRRISAQNREIQHKVEELKTEHARQDDMRREFTANVSHELKTPLTSISGYAELMQNGMVRAEDVPRFSGVIYHEAQRMIVLVNDIIRLSRLDDQDVQEETVSLDLLELCRETAETLRPAAQEKQLELRLEGESAPFTGVRHIADEIVYNLCDNAIRYNRPGGSVLVRAQLQEDAAVLTVQDTGIGIPEAELSRIFERFYQVDKSHSKEVGGTGLGLSIVKHGAACLGAEVHVESQEGRGTCFTVRFPRKQAE